MSPFLSRPEHSLLEATSVGHSQIVLQVPDAGGQAPTNITCMPAQPIKQEFVVVTSRYVGVLRLCRQTSACGPFQVTVIFIQAATRHAILSKET